MSPAVGAYSGPRATFGAVAQLARNARHVTAAIRRIDTFAFSSLINPRGVQAGRDDSQELFYAQQVSNKTLGLRLCRRQTHAFRLARLSTDQVVPESSDFAVE